MARPSVRRDPGGWWVARCALPCRAQVHVRTWAEAMEHATRWGAKPHRLPWGPALHVLDVDPLPGGGRG